MVPEKLKTEPPNLDWICNSDHVHGHGLIDDILIPFIKKLRHEIYHDSKISPVQGFVYTIFRLLKALFEVKVFVKLILLNFSLSL